MKAGNHIRGQVKLHRSFAAFYREKARALRQEADELERRADEDDAAAFRWAAGTDIENISR